VEILASGPAWSNLTASRLPHVYSFRTARERYPSLPVYAGPERIERDDWTRPVRARRLVEQMVAWLVCYLAESRPSAILLTDATEQLGADQLLELARRSELKLAQPRPFADVEIRRESAGEAA